MSPYLATVLTFLSLLTFVVLFDLLAQRRFLGVETSRKAIRIGIGVIFVLCWLLYPDGPLGPILAALIPLGATVYIALVGLGPIKDKASASIFSPSGERRGLLVGPVIAGVVFVAVTLIYWRDSLVGIPALMMLCATALQGGPAAKAGSFHWPWARRRSLAGTAAVLLGGWLLSMLIFSAYVGIGHFSGPINRFVMPAAAVALAGTLADLLPVGEFDSLFVPVACLLVGSVAF